MIPEISVIIPTYKPGVYIYECIDSLLNQTLDKELYEIILVLNGPREPYLSDLSNYVQKQANVVLLYEESAGVSHARNMGLDKARGEYICFVDDDDIVSIEYLSSLLKVADRRTLVVADVNNFIENISNSSDDYISKTFRKFRQNRKGNIFELRSFLSTVSGKVIPVNVIENYRFNSNLQIGEDTLFMFAISKNVKEIKLADGAIYYRRCRPESASRKKRTLAFTLRNSLAQMYAYLRVYINSPFQYNMFLFLSRIAASVIHKSKFIALRKKILNYL